MDGEGLELQVLGCGDAMGSGGRLQACFSLRHGDQRILIDFGVTGMIALRAAGIEPNDVDLIVLSHLHGDHFGGLPFLLLDAKWVSARRNPLRLVGPTGLAERLETLRETLYPGSTQDDLGFELEIEEFELAVPKDLGGPVVTPCEVIHQSGGPAFGLRIDWGGKSLAYSGDTEWTENLVGLARGADLFVCEASFFDVEVPFHLTYEKLLEHLPRLECRRILLTHLSRDMLARAGELEIECAEDGLVLQF